MTLEQLKKQKLKEYEKWFGHGKKGHLHGLLAEDYFKEVKVYLAEALEEAYRAGFITRDVEKYMEKHGKQ